MGPTGLISGPQFFPEAGVDQTIPVAIGTTPGTLDSTLTVPRRQRHIHGCQRHASQLDITAPDDSSLSAVLIAPERDDPGYAVLEHRRLGAQLLVNTVFDDTAETSITNGAAPYTGTFQARRQAVRL